MKDLKQILEGILNANDLEDTFRGAESFDALISFLKPFVNKFKSKSYIDIDDCVRASDAEFASIEKDLQKLLDQYNIESDIKKNAFFEYLAKDHVIINRKKDSDGIFYNILIPCPGRGPKVVSQVIIAAYKFKDFVTQKKEKCIKIYRIRPIPIDFDPRHTDYYVLGPAPLWRDWYASDLIKN